jgi:hypothetical protein
MRIFGEDAVSAPLGIRNAADESPLHGAAFRVSLATLPEEVPPEHAAPATAPEQVALADLPQIPTPVASNPRLPMTHAFQRAPIVTHVTAEYQPATIATTGTAESAFSFPIRPTTESSFGFAAQSGTLVEPGVLSSSGEQLPVTMRVGNLRLQAHFGAASQIGAADTESDEILPAFIAPYTSVNRASLDAAVAVSVAPRLLVGVGYDTEHLLAGYQAPGVDALDARNDTYTGKVTFLIPRFSSALSLSAEQYRYQDNLLQSDAYTQLRESLNLTVKF